jgi:hypothetical protein
MSILSSSVLIKCCLPFATEKVALWLGPSCLGSIASGSRWRGRSLKQSKTQRESRLPQLKEKTNGLCSDKGRRERGGLLGTFDISGQVKFVGKIYEAEKNTNMMGRQTLPTSPSGKHNKGLCESRFFDAHYLPPKSVSGPSAFCRLPRQLLAGLLVWIQPAWLASCSALFVSRVFM